jgi:hypothetical protein
MDNSSIDSALEMNSAYSLFCKQDSLTWLTGQLDIARRIYQDHDSSIHYLKLIYDREDFRKEWKEEELLIGLVLHFDAADEKDSACKYVKKLEEIDALSVLREKYPGRVGYCK